MKSEMDVLGLNEAGRVAWLRANRVALMFVGLVWLAMIAVEISRGRTPWFLIIMVPVIALVRYAAYRYYRAR